MEPIDIGTIRHFGGRWAAIKEVVRRHNRARTIKRNERLKNQVYRRLARNLKESP